MLAAALKEPQTEFTQPEMDDLKLGKISYDSYVQAGDKYFIPAEPDFAVVDRCSSADVYALGVFVYRLLTLNFPSFNIKNTDGRESLLKDGMRGAKDFLQDLMDVNAREAMFDRSLNAHSSQLQCGHDIKSGESQEAILETVSESALLAVKNEHLHSDHVPIDMEQFKKTAKAPNIIFLHELKPEDRNRFTIHELDSKNYEIRYVPVNGPIPSVLKISPMHEITLSGRAKNFASIPDQAQEFAFCYPCSETIQKLDSKTALGKLLCEGGFVYFDQHKQIKSIRSI